jgi:hypothetical protein
MVVKGIFQNGDPCSCLMSRFFLSRSNTKANHMRKLISRPPTLVWMTPWDANHATALATEIDYQRRQE